jgi:hypothetical protein
MRRIACSASLLKASTSAIMVNVDSFAYRAVTCVESVLCYILCVF